MAGDPINNRSNSTGSGLAPEKDPEQAASPAVLVVEDDDCAALLLRTMLQKEGYRIQHCRNGQAALQVMGESRFDAVVLDLMMPGIDGLQVLKQMRCLPQHVSTPVIVISAARLKMVEEEAARHGARLYLDKTQHAQLLPALREIVKESMVQPPVKLRMAAPVKAKTPVEAPPENEEAKGLGRFFRKKT